MVVREFKSKCGIHQNALTDALSFIVDHIYKQFVKPFINDNVHEVSFMIYKTIPNTMRTLYSFIHSLLFSTIKKSAIRHIIYFTPFYIPQLKRIANLFLEYSKKIREKYLLPKHHKGNTDNTAVTFLYNSLLTA